MPVRRRNATTAVLLMLVFLCASGYGQTAPKPAPPTVTTLILQGKDQYRKARYVQALQKFEAALKLEPLNDEALGLGADTAFRLDNQVRARELFLARSQIAGQKESVKAFCLYSTALTYWRVAHDIVAKVCVVNGTKLTCPLPDKERSDLNAAVSAGLDFAEKALLISANNASAHNLINLLNSEAALAASDADESMRRKDLAVAALKKAISIGSNAGSPQTAESNFNLPTVRIGEIPATSSDIYSDDPMVSLVKGGIPVTRAAPAFPSAGIRSKPKETSDPSATGVTDKGGAYSLGAGRGALTAAYSSGTVKVEVLVSKAGDVVFVHVVNGRDDLNGAAVLAARKWKFAPATFEGTPVQISGVITFDLRPPGSSPKKTQ